MLLKITSRFKRAIEKLFNSKNVAVIHFNGDFDSWSDAASSCVGYDSKEILDKVLHASLMVKGGNASFERDSVIFDSIQYSWPVLAGLMFGANLSGESLSVLDYGGSLGSSYYQNKKFLNLLQAANWSVVEQPEFVRAGRKFIQGNNLFFYESIEACVQDRKPNVFLLSSVLQYLENPEVVLMEVFKAKPKVIILDRTCYLRDGNKSKISVQVIPGFPYTASYPCRFFIEELLVNLFDRNGYSLIESFVALDDGLSEIGTWKGHIFVETSTMQALDEA